MMENTEDETRRLVNEVEVNKLLAKTAFHQMDDAKQCVAKLKLIILELEQKIERTEQLMNITKRTIKQLNQLFESL